jgi:hypothetical protein
MSQIWQVCRVSPPVDARQAVSVITRTGERHLWGAPAECLMSPRMVRAARAQGCSVEPRS